MFFSCHYYTILKRNILKLFLYQIILRQRLRPDCVRQVRQLAHGHHYAHHRQHDLPDLPPRQYSVRRPGPKTAAVG